MEKELKNQPSIKDIELKSMKVSIGHTNVQALDKKIQQLRLAHCTASPSKLVDKIVSVFLEKYFEKEFENLKEKLFDKKKYVRSLLKKSSSDEDIDRGIKILKSGKIK